MVKLQIYCDDDARLVQNEFEYPNNVSPLVKLVIHPKWDHSIELVSRTMCTAAAKEKRERNSGLGRYPDWMVDREAVRANIHAPRPFSSDRNSAEPSRLDMDVEEPPPQVMPTRDILSPGVNMSVGATGTSSQTTSLLVSAAELPTFTVVTPGSREFNRLMTYARNCENQGQDLRIDKWPRLLRSNMNTQYRFNFCMAEGSSHRQDEWQSFSASQLRECLEKMTPGYRSHYTEDPFAEFSRWLGRHSVTIDWSQLSEPRAHPFFVASNDVVEKYRRMLSVMTRPLTTEEKKGLMKSFRECIAHKGASDKGISNVTTDFRTKLVNIFDFEEFDLYRTRVFGKNAKRSRESESTQSGDQNRSSSDPAKRPKPTKSNNSSTQPSFKKRCRGCGWNLKKSEQGKYRCPRNGNDGCGQDPRRNNSGAPWDQSEVGKKWTSMGYPGGLPKDETITLQNAEERKKSFTGGESVCYAQHSDKLLISRELINFSLYDDVQAGNRRKRRRATVEMRPPLC